jgi:GNAT superfamily N-acetyltransferase
VVFGELYRLRAPKQLLREFDMYEACGEGFAEPAEYIRQILTVTCDDGAVSEAWTYIYNWPVADLPRIASGRFLGKYTPMLRKLASTETDAAALVHRTAFDDALPALAGLHTPAEDRWFFRERVFEACELWGAFDRAALLGIIAFRAGWIDHLYVLPIAQGHGVGTQLLQVAQSSFGDLQLWTFQCNLRARRFYETRGFVLAEETDGARNEEREPDARYRWRRPE